jgi:hypothetical protein
MRVGRAAGVGAGGKTKQTAPRPHGYLAPFAPDPTWCQGHPMSVLLPKGGMPRVAAECVIWVISGHSNKSKRCLLYPQKRTKTRAVGMSALCQ